MEQLRICAFIDILGFGDLMLGDDADRRNGLIQLLHRLAERAGAYGPNVQEFGLGVVMAPSAEVTTFSDNIVLSFPLTTFQTAAAIGNQPHQLQVEASAFMRHLLIQIVAAVWDGLKLGVLFRGGITTGRLFHDGRVVAGSALVNAYCLEKATLFPRIEIEQAVMTQQDEHNRPLLEDWVRESFIKEEDGRFFVRALDFHAGYWAEHNWYRSKEGLPAQSPAEALAEIQDRLRIESAKIRTSAKEDKVKQKWEWFDKEFAFALSTDPWQKALSSPTTGN